MSQKVGKKEKNREKYGILGKMGKYLGKIRGLVVDFYGTVPVKFIGESGESNSKYWGNVGDKAGVVLVNFSGTDPVEKGRYFIYGIYSNRTEEVYGVGDVDPFAGE